MNIFTSAQQNDMPITEKLSSDPSVIMAEEGVFKTWRDMLQNDKLLYCYSPYQRPDPWTLRSGMQGKKNSFRSPLYQDLS